MIFEKNKNYNFEISVDGGINNETAKIMQKMVLMF